MTTPVNGPKQRNDSNRVDGSNSYPNHPNPNKCKKVLSPGKCALLTVFALAMMKSLTEIYQKYVSKMHGPIGINDIIPTSNIGILATPIAFSITSYFLSSIMIDNCSRRNNVHRNDQSQPKEDHSGSAAADESDAEDEDLFFPEIPSPRKIVDDTKIERPIIANRQNRDPAAQGTPQPILPSPVPTPDSHVPTPVVTPIIQPTQAELDNQQTPSRVQIRVQEPVATNQPKIDEKDEQKLQESSEGLFQSWKPKPWGGRGTWRNDVTVREKNLLMSQSQRAMPSSTDGDSKEGGIKNGNANPQMSSSASPGVNLPTLVQASPNVPSRTTDEKDNANGPASTPQNPSRKPRDRSPEHEAVQKTAFAQILKGEEEGINLPSFVKQNVPNAPPPPNPLLTLNPANNLQDHQESISISDHAELNRQEELAKKALAKKPPSPPMAIPDARLHDPRKAKIQQPIPQVRNSQNSAGNKPKSAIATDEKAAIVVSNSAMSSNHSRSVSLALPLSANVGHVKNAASAGSPGQALKQVLSAAPLQIRPVEVIEKKKSTSNTEKLQGNEKRVKDDGGLGHNEAIPLHAYNNLDGAGIHVLATSVRHDKFNNCPIFGLIKGHIFEDYFVGYSFASELNKIPNDPRVLKELLRKTLDMIPVEYPAIFTIQVGGHLWIGTNGNDFRALLWTPNKLFSLNCDNNIGYCNLENGKKQLILTSNNSWVENNATTAKTYCEADWPPQVAGCFAKLNDSGKPIEAILVAKLPYTLSI